MAAGKEFTSFESLNIELWEQKVVGKSSSSNVGWENIQSNTVRRIVKMKLNRIHLKFNI